MGMGYGISEQLILDEKTGRPLNGNLLDYKLMTMLDTPELKADFVELDDPIGPYGNKALVSRLRSRVHRRSEMPSCMQQELLLTKIH